MTEKLLSKPPFLYLHDIFLSTMGKTGFGKGLFTDDEMNSRGGHDKVSKFVILKKIIRLTEMTNGEKIDVNPSKIVAGLLPEKTNIFL